MGGKRLELGYVRWYQLRSPPSSLAVFQGCTSCACETGSRRLPRSYKLVDMTPSHSIGYLASSREPHRSDCPRSRPLHLLSALCVVSLSSECRGLRAHWICGIDRYAKVLQHSPK